MKKKLLQQHLCSFKYNSELTYFQCSSLRQINDLKLKSGSLSGGSSPDGSSPEKACDCQHLKQSRPLYFNRNFRSQLQQM